MPHSLNPVPTPRARSRAPFWIPAAGLVLLMGLSAVLWLSPRPLDHRVLFWLATGCIVITAVVLGQALTNRRRLRQTQEELAQHRGTTLPQLRVIWDKAPLSITLFDPSDPQIAAKIVDCNPMTCEMHGYTREEMIGHSADLLEAVPWTQNVVNWLETFHKQGRREGESQHKRKDGSTFWIEYFTSLLVIDGKEYVIGMDRDATARKQAQMELVGAKEAAEAATKAKSEFLANMSHEIRTPMNGVIGMTGLLLDTKLDETQREFTETIRTCADTLMTVINDILDFSKIEAGKMDFEELDFNLVETVEGTLDMLAERAQRKNIELISAIPPDVPTGLCGDPGRLRQVLVNLVGNAIKFTERGEVVIRVFKESETETHATLRFNVVDTGIGIPLEVQQRLFQAFTQADSSTTRRYGGTGLGLAISKQIVAMMNGQIGVQSEPGQGTTFWFTATLAKMAGMPKAVPDYSRDLFDLRVLVVDDNATNRQILRHQIVAWKMQKGSAANGHEALKILRAAVATGKPYDVALLDMQMPEMDGLTLAKAIKADPSIALTRLIILTSLGHPMSSAELTAAGIDAYLVKPVKQSRLFDCLVDVVGHAEAENIFTRPASAVAVAVPFSPDSPAKARILLAEDNSVNQRVALAQFKKLGYSADAVGNGLEAVEALDDVPYDIVFMDCQMPEMDGYEATHCIRKREENAANAGRLKPHIHIIAMTANAMQGDREKCLAAGMDDYVSKPVRETELSAALDRWAASRQTAVFPS